MPKEVTNEELARAIAKGFSGVDKSFEVVGADITGLKTDVAGLKTDVADLKQGQDDIARRFSIVERKLDSVLYDEMDRHDRWIHQLADKVGIELVR